MIKTEAQAKAVQGRRYAAEKLGIAKAVRRYYKRSTDSIEEYLAKTRKLKAKWPLYMEDGSAS